MKRSGSPRRRSKKGQDYEDEYQARAQLVRVRSGGRCEIRSSHDCDGFAQEWPHHRKLRSQGGSNSTSNLLDVCWSGHVWIHQQLPRVEAERLQLLVPRDVPEYPYDPTELP